MSNTTVSGKVTPTGVALNIPLGWVPDYVKVFNYNDAGALYPTLEWFKGMPAASGLKTLSIADNGATALKSSNRITANGITTYSDTTGAGFTLGADADLNVNAEEVYFFASRNIDGAR